ncbi:MAG TPA: EAL domain-containing protein [Kineosporiaceae bacterium]|nr:EAL domain-containing protein [Kineosporiaceae bacterium]
MSVIGLTVMAAWYLRWTALLRAYTGTWPITFNTGIGLTLSGAALTGMTLGLRWPAALAGGFDLAAGSATVAEYVTGRSLGIDQLFPHAYLVLPGTLPGRIAPNAAVCWMLIGAGILASVRSRPPTRTLVLALPGAAVVALAVVAVFGYAAGLPNAYEWGRLTGMSVSTACGLGLLGSAMMLQGWADTPAPAQRAQWWALPAGLLTLVLDVFLWLALTGGSQRTRASPAQFVRATALIGLLLAAAVTAAVWAAQRAGAADRAQRESEERFRLAFDESLVGTALLSVDPQTFRIRRVNAALCAFLGRDRTALLGVRLVDVLSPEEAADTQEALEGVLSGAASNFRAERRFRHANDETVWGLLGATMIRDALGGPRYLLCQVEDITTRKRAEEQLVHRALYDDLTGLPNRALLMEHLAGALARAQRSGSPVGVLFIDLDDFKSINDSFGHSAGDEFLTRAAARIQASIRASDLPARVGGDEFVIICENLTDPADATLVADQIQRALSAQIPLRGQLVTTGASVGIALSRHGSTAESMLRDADAAMYVAKRRGGRRWEPADDALHAAATRVLTVESELHRALELQEFRVHYQPLIDLQTGSIVAVEALLRWQHPDRGLLLPAEFVDVAEQRNLIGDIGTWVLRTACAQAAIWRRRHGAAAPSLAVNVSSRQLDGRGLGTHIEDVLRACPLPADQLYLEVTESQLLIATRSSLNELRGLADSGIRIAVDDFGTGYAGFDYLRRLPVHELKIGSSYVDGTGTDPTDTAITAGVVTLGLNLGLIVVAEGIETHRQLTALRDMGCTWGQGWLWYHALPADDIDTLLAAAPSGSTGHLPGGRA